MGSSHPEDFTSNIKAYRVFTAHQTNLQTLRPDLQHALLHKINDRFYYDDLPGEIVRELWMQFRAAVEPLGRAELGAILFQFPPWFVKKRANVEPVLLCAEMLEGLQLAVEFRNNTWFNERHASSALKMEREHGLVHVIVDEPQGTAFSIPSRQSALSARCV